MTKRLGRGLADLLGASTEAGAPSSYVMLRLDQMRTSRFQPRTAMATEALEELKASIRKTGVIEPVIVRPVAHGTYELVAGERRFRASQAVGLQEIPAIIKPLTDREAFEFSIIENVQREDLNPVDEARAYARLMEEFGYTQEEVAAGVGRERATIANALRLLALPEDILRAVEQGTVSRGHAKVLLSIPTAEEQRALFQRMLSEPLSVRETEAAATTLAPTRRRRSRRVESETRPIEDALRQALGTKVTLTTKKKGGRIVIDYFSAEDLERILRVLGIGD